MLLRIFRLCSIWILLFIVACGSSSPTKLIPVATAVITPITPQQTTTSFDVPHDNYTIYKAGQTDCDYASLKCLLKGEYHTGIDSTGAEVIRASGPGIVVVKQDNNQINNQATCNGQPQGDCGFGNTIILKHTLADGSLVYSQYSHMSKITDGISVGECVQKGQSMGIMGGSGYGLPDKYNVHLHLEFKTAPVLGDPTSVFTQPKTYTQGHFFGYIPGSDPQYHPDKWGYIDPKKFIDDKSKLAVVCNPSGAKITPIIITTPPTPTYTLTPLATLTQITSMTITPTPRPTPTRLGSNWIAFIGGDNNIYLTKPDGTGLTQITRDGKSDSGSPDQNIYNQNIKWSPDGSLLGFARIDGKGSQIEAYRIADKKFISIISGTEGSFDWLNDSQTILYSDVPFELFSTRGTLSGGLSTIDINSKITSPFIKSDPNLRMTNPRVASNDIGVYFQIRPAPSAKNYSGEMIGISKIPRGNYVKVSNESDCDWSPDGNLLACGQSNISSQCNNINIFTFDGEKLTSIPIEKGCSHSTTPRWSPDGQWLTFESDINSGKPDVWLMKADGSSLLDLTPNMAYGSSPQWSSDGRLIAFLSGTSWSQNIFTIKMDGTGRKNVTLFPEGVLSFDWQPSSSLPLETPTIISTKVDMTDIKSILYWFAYGLKYGTIDPFNQIIVESGLLYGTGLAGGRDPITRDTFLKDLAVRLPSKPICVGYQGSNTNDSLKIYTTGWKPQWAFRGIPSSDDLTFSFVLTNGDVFITAYFTPSSQILTAPNVKSSPCPQP